MKVFRKINSLKKALNQIKSESKTIGLVPTMGALHSGHSSLINHAIKDNDIVVCSIFVNPIQFNNPSDLEAYPKDLEKDLELLEKLGCHIVFLPEAIEMYPSPTNLQINFGYLEKPMEGAFRKGHFNGVGVVVSKLFNIVAPHKAYFGQKDLQQCLIIQNLVDELNFDIQLVCVPIVRENNGLAISSRNQRLTAAQIDIASNLYKTLRLGESLLRKDDDVAKVKKELNNYLQQWPEINLEYIEVVNKDTLQCIKDFEWSQEIALCIAAFIGKVRLIDNIILKK